MDDIVVHGKTEKVHDDLIIQVFERLERNNMRINPKKIQFKLSSVKLLGVTVDGKTQTPSEIKKNETLAYPIPNNVSELRRFLGLTGGSEIL